MTKKLTLKVLSGELEVLASRVMEVEKKVEASVEAAVARLKKMTETHGKPEASEGGDSAAVTPEQRQRMIEEAAYRRAESRGFVGGDPRQDWLEAEAEVERKLKGSGVSEKLG